MAQLAAPPSCRWRPMADASPKPPLMRSPQTAPVRRARRDAAKRCPKSARSRSSLAFATHAAHPALRGKGRSALRNGTDRRLLPPYIGEGGGWSSACRWVLKARRSGDTTPPPPTRLTANTATFAGMRWDPKVSCGAGTAGGGGPFQGHGGAMHMFRSRRLLRRSRHVGAMVTLGTGRAFANKYRG